MDDDTITRAINETVGFVGKNVGLVIVGGVAIGLLAAALMPRSTQTKLAKRSRKISAHVGELSHAMTSQAGNAASEGRVKIDGLSKRIGETVSEHAQEVKKQTAKIASDAAVHLNDSGKAIVQNLVKSIEKVRSPAEKGQKKSPLHAAPAKS